MGGDDSLTGGAGDDIYLIEDSGDTYTETHGGGADLVISYWSSLTLGANVENLQLAGSAVKGTGNTLNNILYAGAGDNILDGGDGIDTSSYAFAMAGVTASLGTSVAQATGGSGSDTLLNFEKNLTGSNFNDTLTGDANANTLVGGLGNDIFTGGAGNDLFIFGANCGSDRINDFAPGSDKIQLDGALGVANFAALDTNSNSVLDDADSHVIIAGNDTILLFGSDQIDIVGQAALHSIDFWFV